MSEYYEGVCGDGVAILKDGERMTISEILMELDNAESLRQQLAEANEMRRSATDYSIGLQRLIEHTARGVAIPEHVATACPYHTRLLAEARAGRVPEGWREVLDRAMQSIGAGSLSEAAEYERGIVRPHLDGVFDELERLERDQQPPAAKPCEYCDDTGDVHTPTGEWRGVYVCAAGKQLQAEQQYFYRVNECKAIDSKSDLCICWHAQGAGPLPDAKPGDEVPATWRNKPMALSNAPCSKCGYNGPGYYQPDTHPCAAQPEPAPDTEQSLFGTVAGAFDTGCDPEQRVPAKLRAPDALLGPAVTAWVQRRKTNPFRCKFTESARFDFIDGFDHGYTAATGDTEQHDPIYGDKLSLDGAGGVSRRTVDTEIAKAIHWPDCWDTAAYPTAVSALHEVYEHFRCTTCGNTDQQRRDALREAVEYLDSNKLNSIGAGSILHRNMRAAIEAEGKA